MTEPTTLDQWHQQMLLERYGHRHPEYQPTAWDRAGQWARTDLLDIRSGKVPTHPTDTPGDAA